MGKVIYDDDIIEALLKNNTLAEASIELNISLMTLYKRLRKKKWLSDFWQEEKERKKYKYRTVKRIREGLI